jgi:tRNA-2-methylthio-N6-dimethylallyladenosine synthase
MSLTQLKDLNYYIKCFGCQMNKSDSEHVAGMLTALGARPVTTAEQADVVVFLTCCVREAADVRLIGQVASLKNLPSPHGQRVIAVGGCMGQRDGAKLREQLPHVDVVFGTHNLPHLPALLAAVLGGEGAQVEVLDEEGDVNTTPREREQSWHAWLPIMTGCNNFCSYCVVPYVRGREQSRDFDEVLREVDSLLADGVREITLLGQNVNSYGRDLYGQPRFAELLRVVGASGVERLRFATSHPKDLSPETIAAFAETATVMPALHLPVQSGSDRVLKAMNRHYRIEQYLKLVSDLRAACRAAGKDDGQPALSTDIIVGFPGETEADFEATCKLVRAVGYTQAFTFIYSRREGTRAAALPDDTPHELIQQRFDRLVDLVQQSAWEQNQFDLGRTVGVLVEGTSKRDARMLSGRSPKNQTVHAALPVGADADAFIGQILPIRITEARTWYLRGELA